MVSSTYTHESTHHEGLLEISEAPPHSSSYFGDWRALPPAIKFIFWNEFCERFSFYGLKAILALFLLERLGLSQVRSTQMFHLFTMACFATPILGAVISDSFLGKYRTILYLSLLYAVGNWMMSMAAIPDPDPVTQKASRGAYEDRRAVGSAFTTVLKVIVSAVRLRKNESDYVNYERAHCRGGLSSSATHWLDAAKLRCGAEEVEDVKSLMRVCVFLLPAPLFFCMFSQTASTWVFQARQMNGRASCLGNVVIRPDQMQALHPLFLIFLPLFEKVIYPFLENHGISMKEIRRMILGMLLCSVAFFTSALLQLAIDKRTTPGSITSYINTFSDSVRDIKDHMGLFILAFSNETPKKLSILWQVPQYVILSAADVSFIVTGYKFAYSQAPVSMKSVVQAVWLLTSGAGNLITILIVGIIGNKLSTAQRSCLFAVGGIIAMVFMMWLLFQKHG